MGYSCSQAASNTLKNLMAILRTDPKTSTNVWSYDGNSYFYEIGRENYDYSITGSVHQFVGQNSAKKIGTFKIANNGKLIRWPRIPANIRKQFR